MADFESALGPLPFHSDLTLRGLRGDASSLGPFEGWGGISRWIILKICESIRVG